MIEFTAIVLLCTVQGDLDSCENVARFPRWSTDEETCRQELQADSRDYFFQMNPDGTPMFPDMWVATKCEPVEMRDVEG